MRKRLPATRGGQTHKVMITDSNTGDAYDLYIISNFHDDGELGEVFLNIGKQGSTLQGLLDGWAINLSVGLQHGVPLDTIVKKFTGQHFMPAGKTSDEMIPECSSIFDYVVRYLERLVR